MLNSRKTGFEAFYCQPGPEGAHEKGGVEGEIGRFRRRWFVPVPRAASLAALNARLAEADAAEDGRHIAGRAATVGEDFGVERGLLLPLPPEPFGTAAVLWPRVDRYARISVGKCRYSVPARLIGSRVRVMLSANELRIFDGSKLAAVHPRLIAAGDEHLELDHYLEILVRKPGALPGSAALAQARAAGAFTSAHDAFWAAARARHGDAAGTRALIEVLLLHRRMPASQVIAGMTAALGAGSCSPDVVAVEARKHAAATPGPAAGPSWPAAQPRRSRADQPPVPGAFAGLGAAGRHGGLAEDGAQVLVAFLALARPLPLPDWWSCGARPPQETRCGPVRNLVMSTPVSATASWAARRAQPGIDSAWASCSSYGASSCSITAVRSSMSAVSRSMRASILASRTACAGVKNSAPSKASSSWLILRRAAVRASWASTLGLRWPAIRWSMMARPVTPCRSVRTEEILIAADSSSFSRAASPGSVLRSGPAGSGCAAG